jgi:hypothetical protein
LIGELFVTVFGNRRSPQAHINQLNSAVENKLFTVLPPFPGMEHITHTPDNEDRAFDLG